MDNREIDELLATKVMGWIETDMPSIPIYDDEEIVWIREDGLEISAYNFRPSERIEDAWEVAEKFPFIEIEKEYDKYFACIYTGTTNPKCEKGSQIVYLSEADTAPMAICMAALRSAGLETRKEH